MQSDRVGHVDRAARRGPIAIVRNLCALSCALLLSLVLIIDVIIGSAKAETPFQQMAKKTCSVMAGQQKPDGQSLQYLMMLDDPDNPITEAFTREVVARCPKTYLEYNNRKRQKAINPYPPGSLLR